LVTTVMGGGDTGSESAPTTTESPPDTTSPADDPQATTLPALVTTMSTTSTSTTSTTTTTTIPFVNQRAAPVLGTRTNGSALFVVNDGALYRVDLDSGRTTTLDRSGPVPSVSRALVAGDRIVLTGGTGVFSLRQDLQGQPVRLADNDVSVLSGRDGDRLWVIRYPTPSSGGYEVRVVDTAGRVLAELTVDRTTYPVGVLGDRLVLQGPGRLFTLDPSGALAHYAFGTAVSVNGDWILWTGCDERARCTHHLGSPTEPDTGRTSLETSYLSAYSDGELGAGPAALSPDGATVVGPVTAGDGTVLHIVDLATGSVLDPDSRGDYYTPAWSPDGAWLFRVFAFSSRRLEAVSVRTGKVIALDVPGLYIQGNRVPALALG
jgi:hypothetical protein